MLITPLHLIRDKDEVEVQPMLTDRATDAVKHYSFVETLGSITIAGHMAWISLSRHYIIHSSLFPLCLIINSPRLYWFYQFARIHTHFCTMWDRGQSLKLFQLEESNIIPIPQLWIIFLSWTLDFLANTILVALYNQTLRSWITRVRFLPLWPDRDLRHRPSATFYRRFRRPGPKGRQMSTLRQESSSRRPRLSGSVTHRTLSLQSSEFPEHFRRIV